MYTFPQTMKTFHFTVFRFAATNCSLSHTIYSLFHPLGDITYKSCINCYNRIIRDGWKIWHLSHYFCCCTSLRRSTNSCIRKFCDTRACAIASALWTAHLNTRWKLPPPAQPVPQNRSISETAQAESSNNSSLDWWIDKIGPRAREGFKF